MHTSTKNASFIPIIDISNANAQTGDDLVNAVTEWGFVYIRGIGVGFTKETIDRMFQLSHDFFHLSKEEKKRHSITEDNKGYSSLHAEILDPQNQKRGDVKEAFNFGEFMHSKAQQSMPESLVSQETEIYRFELLCRDLCTKLLRLFALGLKISAEDGGENWFSSRHDPRKGPSGSILRLLYYPAGQDYAGYDSSIDVRAGAHSDYGSLTLLFQRDSQPGLEILTPGQSWSSAPVFPPGTEGDKFPPILVNIGDLLNYWTDGLLKSTVHRVVFPQDGGSDRYSIAYFCHPANDTRLVQIPSEMINNKNSKKHRSHSSRNTNEIMTAQEHLNVRLAATYGWEKQDVPSAS